MKQQKTLLAVAFLTFAAVTSTSQASLFARGTDMVYDDANNITWASDANLFQTQAAGNSNLVNEIIAGNGGVIHDTPNLLDTVANSGKYTLTSGDFNTSNGMMTWWGAQAWANNLSLGGFTNWALPTTVPAASGYNQTGSQMGDLFYNQLGGVEGTSINTTHNANYNVFSNVQSSVYWSSSDYAPNPVNAWVFLTDRGFQFSNLIKANQLYAWAVRPGDVAASSVPVPAAVWLFGSGLIGLASFTRRKNKSTILITA
jgi:hypothetical protein